MKFFATFLIMLTFVLQTGCGESLTRIAENQLYPLDFANKTAVPDVPPEGLEKVFFDVEASDGSMMEIEAWHYTAPNPNANVIVYVHGNGWNLGGIAEANFHEALMSLNSHLIIHDHPGYGNSTGTPNEKNLVNAGQAAYDFMLQRFPNNPMIIWGRSLGAGVATQMAANNQGTLDGLILTSGWNRFFDLAVHHVGLAKQLPQEWIDQHNYDSQGAAAKINTLTLIHHGTADKVIPVEFGRKLYSGFPENGMVRYVELEGRGHNDVYAEASVWQDIRNFLR